MSYVKRSKLEIADDDFQIPDELKDLPLRHQEKLSSKSDKGDKSVAELVKVFSNPPIIAYLKFTRTTESGVERYTFEGEKKPGFKFGAPIEFNHHNVQKKNSQDSTELEKVVYSKAKGTVVWYIDSAELTRFYMGTLTLCPTHELIFAQIPGVYFKALKLVSRHKIVRGSVLYKQGQPGHLWVVAFGELSLNIKVDNPQSYLKSYAPIRQVARGALLGSETYVLHEVSPQKTYACTAIATSPVALVYSIDFPALAELKKVCKDFGWREFIDGCRVNLEELKNSIKNVLAAIELQNKDPFKTPKTALRQNSNKREYFMMGNRFMFLYKKEEVGKV